MVKIRLRRTGAKKQPHYRLVVTDTKAPRDGRFIEAIGHYNPRTDPPTVEIDTERALHWLGVGAQPSAAVKRLFDRENITAQVAVVRKGEVSIKDLAAEFRQAQAEEEAGVAAILEPAFLGQAAETVPDVEPVSLDLPEAISPDEEDDLDDSDEDDDLVDSDDWEDDASDDLDDDDDDFDDDDEDDDD